MAKNWTRNELLVAMNLYCRIPFGQFHHKNPTIIQIARYLDRTPGSLAMKLCNLASLDPTHQARGVKGLSGASAKDREIWSEFENDWGRLVHESERQMSIVMRNDAGRDSGNTDDFEEDDQLGLAKGRSGQAFFRAAVLSAYENRCCITGLAEPELLNASHIIPWNKDKHNRLNPRNGLCLEVLHDRAFDRGFVTVAPDLTVRVSPVLETAPIPSESKDFLFVRAGRHIRPPHRFLPNPEFLAWHNRNVFRA